MRATVVICTWNRSTLLERALASLADQRIPQSTSWELLIVNNNCTDDTDSVVSSFATRLPIRCLHEKSPGLSNARNRALAEARGDYILWTDDDVKVSPEWLSSYLSAFRDFPDCGVFGGPILPDFEGVPPNWLRSGWQKVQDAYAIRDFGSEDQEFSVDGRLPYGANFVIRGDLQRSHPYDPNLGRAPEHKFRGGEEIAVIRAIMSEGWHGRWVPAAAVLHWIPKSRQSLKYIRDYWKGQGISVGTTGDFDSYPSILGIPRWILRARVQDEIRYRFARLFLSPQAWVGELTAVSYSSALLKQMFSRRAMMRTLRRDRAQAEPFE